MLEETAHSGRNSWYEARESLGQTAGYVQDVSRAWELADDANQDKTSISRIIGWQCCYALIVASLNSLAQNVPPALLIALVRKEVWTAEQGVTYALQISDPQQKVEVITRLTQLENYLPAPLKQKILQAALEAAQAIQSEQYRASALSALADKLPESLLPEALEAARAIQNKSERLEIVTALAPHLPTSLLPRVINELQQIEDSASQRQALVAFIKAVPQLSEELGLNISVEEKGRQEEQPLFSEPSLSDSKTQVDSVEDMIERLNSAVTVEDWSSLILDLPNDLLPEALQRAISISEEVIRSHALSRLVPGLVELPPSVLYPLFRNSLPALATYIRPSLLSDIADLGPVILALGGKEAAIETVRAIQDVGRWFP